MEENRTEVIEAQEDFTNGAGGSSDSDQSKQRLFTQEEVNQIIRKRLNTRKQEKQETENEINERVSQAVAERTAELDARERRFECKSYLAENGYASELLDIFDTSDVEQFKSKVEAVQSVYGKPATAIYPNVYDGGEAFTPIGIENAAIHSAFKNTEPHKPKSYNPLGG